VYVTASTADSTYLELSTTIGSLGGSTTLSFQYTKLSKQTTSRTCGTMPLGSYSICSCTRPSGCSSSDSNKHTAAAAVVVQCRLCHWKHKMHATLLRISCHIDEDNTKYRRMICKELLACKAVRADSVATALGVLFAIAKFCNCVQLYTIHKTMHMLLMR
jgi:hypothetical protein